MPNHKQVFHLQWIKIPCTQIPFCPRPIYIHVVSRAVLRLSDNSALLQCATHAALRVVPFELKFLELLQHEVAAIRKGYKSTLSCMINTNDGVQE